METKSVLALKNTIFYILLISFILRVTVTFTVENHMYLYSDDVNYIYSAIDFIKSGHITYVKQDYITVFGMPGMFLFLAGIFKVFGYDQTGIIVARLIFDLLGTFLVYGVYLTTKEIVRNIAIANIAAVLAATCIPLICLNNLFLTETPALCLLIFLIYYFIKYAEQPTEKNFIVLVSLYIVSVLFKPVFGIFPIAFLPIFLFNRFPVKFILKRGIMAALALCVCVAPWSIKNYCVTGDFIPLSGNQGDTLLLGSFDGEDVPSGTYDEAVELARTRVQNAGLDHPYYEMKERGEIGEIRIQEWKENNPRSYFKSTYLLKPLKLIKSLYYPIEVFNIDADFVYFFYNIQLIFSVVGIGYSIIIVKRKPKFTCYIFSLIIGFVLLLFINAHYAALPRYGVTNLIIIPILSAIGLYHTIKVIASCLKRVEIRKCQEF